MDTNRFEVAYHGGTARSYFRTATAAHVLLGKLAAEKDAEVHVHEGEWVPSAYSVAYTGTDPILSAVAVVRLANK